MGIRLTNKNSESDPYLAPLTIIIVVLPINNLKLAPDLLIQAQVFSLDRSIRRPYQFFVFKYINT